MNKVIVTLIVVVVIAAIAGVFIFNGPSESSTQGGMDNVNGAAVAPVQAKVINIDASRFEYSQDVIRVKKGEKVRIVVNNVDTTHGIIIPGLGVSGIESVEFTANETGTYEFRCPTMCGTGHRDMKGTIIVEE